jgi:hypothetical protein
LTVFDKRIWGIVPLTLFGLKAWQYSSPGDIYQLLWFCNVSNLLLAVAIFFRARNLIFICATLLTIGLPIWVFDFMVNGDFHVFSVFTHVVSPALGFLVALRLGWSSHVIWQTVAYYLALQLLARLFSPAALNINVAFAVYAPVQKLFPNVIVYSLANLAGLLAFTAGMHRLLRRPAAH